MKDIVINDPSQWRLAMRLGADRLDVTLHSPANPGSLIYRSLELDPAATSRLKGLEAVVYDNPVLLSDFSRISCVIETPFTLILPAGLDSATDDEAITAREDIFAATFPEFEGATILSPSGMPGVAVMGGDDAEIVSFLRRTFFNITLHPHLAPLCRYFLSTAGRGNQPRLYLNMRQGATDIVATRGSQLLMANSFVTPTVADAAYFTMAVRREFAPDAEVMLAGDGAGSREDLSSLLKPLGVSVMPMIFPSVMFRAGKDAMRAPFDLITLPLCE